MFRAHHAVVSSFRDLNSDSVEAWDLRRAWHVRVIRDGAAIVTARSETGVVGYAVLFIEAGADDTFDVGSGVAEIISLAVSGNARAASFFEGREFIEAERVLYRRLC